MLYQTASEFLADDSGQGILEYFILIGVVAVLVGIVLLIRSHIVSKGKEANSGW